MSDDSKGQNSGTLDDILREGIQLLNNQRLEAAEICFKRALIIDPSSKNAHANLGIAYYRKGMPELALEELTLSEKFGCKDEKVYLYISDALKDLGRFEEIIDLAKRANKNVPGSATSHICSGLAYMYLKEYLKAIEEFSIALKINERDSTHNDLGVAFLKAGMLKEAEKEILISMSNEKTDCRYNSLAAVYFEMGRYIESFHAILSSIAIKPNAYTNDNLFEILYKIKSVDNIINECKSFLHKNPHFSDMNYLIATLLDYVGGQGHESEEYYQRIVGMMKNNPQFSERLTPYGQSSNPVRVDLSNPFSHNMFFIKCDDKKRDKIFEMRRLEREFATAAFVSETLRSYNNKARTGEPVAFFDHDDGNIYLISKAQGSRNLRELSADVGFQDSAIEDNVTKCLLNLADIQGYVTRELNGRNDFRVARNGNNYHIKLDRFDYDHDLDRRIFDRFSHNKSSDKVKKLMQGIINANRTGQDFFIHGDMVETNGLEGGAVIDYERCCISDPVADAAALLANPFFCFDSADAFENYYNRLVDSYKGHLDFNEFRKSFAAHNLFYSIGFAGSRQFHGDYNTAKAHINRAVSIMESNKLNELRNCFIGYISEAFKAR